MRSIALAVIFALASLLPLVAQNNSYEIDDECYDYFMQAEAILAKRDTSLNKEFDRVTDRLMIRALTVPDTKAQTLYYVLMLKNVIRQPGSTHADIDQAQQTLCNIAVKTGYRQYYYYAYELVQNYYHNHGFNIKAMELLLEMQTKAQEENDEYGMWVGDRYIGALYLSLNDYVSGKRYIKASLETYQNSTDPTVRRQTVTRQYCDLSDCYPPASDSMRINILLAKKSAQNTLDTLRVEYYLAKLAAWDHDYADFCRHRDHCLQSPYFPGSLFVSGVEYLEAIEAVMTGTPLSHMEAIESLTRYPQQKFIADLGKSYGYDDLSTHMHHKMIDRLENIISSSNNDRLAELEARFGNMELQSDLAEKNRQVALITRIALILISLILVAALLISILRVRNLRKQEETDRLRIEELKAANERVLAADAAKTRFVQNMSHEVRTPLNAIVGFSQLLSLPDGTFPPEEKDEFAGHIVNNTKMLTMLLDDILNASAMDSGEYKINIDDGECHTICTEAINSAEHRLQPGVRMYYAPENPEPYHFRTDPRRVQQILINLLTNACKNTTAGEIKLTSSLTDNPGQVTFAVEDTGPGVPADKAEKIFDRFTKLNDFVQGTGLGLSICRDIAGKMGGRVFLDTSYTGGARFVLTVPADNDTNKKATIN